MLAVQPFPAPLTPEGPDGAQIAAGLVSASVGATAIESFTLEISDDQRFSVKVDPTAELAASLTVRDPSDNVVGSANPGSIDVDAILQGVGGVGGVYTIDVASELSTSGDFDLQIVLNADWETESSTGVANDVSATAQLIDTSFVSLGSGSAQRAAIAGTLSAGSSDDDDWYQFQLVDGAVASIAASVDGGASLGIELYASDGTTRLAMSRTTGGGLSLIDQYLDRTSDSTPQDYLLRVSGSDANYHLGVAVGAAFDLASNDLASTAQEITAAGGALGIVEAGATDFYRVNALVGDTLTIATIAPGLGGTALPNGLDPEIVVFDPTGAPLGHTNVVGAETLIHTVVLDGAYVVSVTPAGDGGGYLVQATGQTGASPGFAVAGVDPVDAAFLPAAPSRLTFDFTDDLSALSLDVNDLVIDGSAITASGVTQIDSDTVAFDLPALAEGPHLFALAAGVLEDADGQLLEAFSSEVVLDYTAPRVVASSVLQNDILSEGTLTYVVSLSEPIDENTLDAGDVQLIGQMTGEYSGTSLAYDEQAMTITVVFDDLAEDLYTLTVLSGDDALQDVAGNDLDGEPGAFPSGNGTAGGDYFVEFSVDQSQPDPLSFDRLTPLGSAIASSWRHPGLINQAGDADVFSFSAAAGSTLALVAEPDDPLAVVTLEVVGLAFPSVAHEPGAPVSLSPLSITQDGTIEVRVKSDRPTSFFLDAVLNASLEGGAGDSDRQHAVDLDASAIDAVPGRFAAVATSTPRQLEVEGLSREGNDTFATSIASGIGFGNGRFVSRGAIGDNPSLSVAGLDVDLVQVRLAAGDRLTAQIDTTAVGGSLDAVLALFREDGTLVALNDDFVSKDPFIDFTAVKPGAYFVGVSGFANLAYNPLIAGSGFAGTVGDYELAIELNASAGPEAPTFVEPDVDYFQIDLSDDVGREIDIVLSGQTNVAQSNGILELLAPDGETVLATGIADPLGAAVENWDQAILDWMVPSAGIYFLRFTTAAPGAYSLVVGTTVMIEAEPNDSFGDPLRLFGVKSTFVGHLGIQPSSETTLSTANPSASGGLTDLTTSNEQEPNGSLAEATVLPLGFASGLDSSVDVVGDFSSSADVDSFRFTLAPGDVLGVAAQGAAETLSLRDRLNVEIVGSASNLSLVYPDGSDLPREGNAVLATVISEAGDYYLQTTGTSGAYSLEMRLFRPTLESQPRGTRQQLFIDFDGADLDRSIFGGTGFTSLSPLHDFLPAWSLDDADENELIDAILATIEENFADVKTTGPNGDFLDSHVPGEYAIEILNSRDDPDPFGNPNVTRVIVGGTVAQLGRQTLGLAESIDVGNLVTSESAVVLLDLLSGSGSSGPTSNSLNLVPLAPTASIIDLVGMTLGNIVSHEAGHLFGAFHTNRANSDWQVTDQGGNLAIFSGLVGAVWGDGDEIDVDFGIDAYSPNEGLTGLQNARSIIAYGLSTGTIDGALLGPALVSVDPAAPFIHDSNLTQITLQFSDPLEIASASSNSNYLLERAGVDRVFGTSDDVVVPLAVAFDGEKSVQIDVGLSSTPLPVGKYRLTARAGILDLDGNPLNGLAGAGSGEDTFYFFEVVQITPQSDVFQIALHAGETIKVSTLTPFDSELATISNDLNPELEVFDPTGAPLAANADGSPDGKNALVSMSISIEGVYSIVVSATSGSGEYLLIVDRDLLGNYNGDLAVNGADFLNWQQAFGQTGAPLGSGADGNQDGVVDGADLQVWETYFGVVSSLVRNTPEGLAIDQPASFSAAMTTAATVDSMVATDAVFDSMGRGEAMPRRRGNFAPAEAFREELAQATARTRNVAKRKEFRVDASVV